MCKILTYIALCVCVMTWYGGVWWLLREREKKIVRSYIYVIDNIKNINKINDNTTVVYIHNITIFFCEEDKIYKMPLIHPCHSAFRSGLALKRHHTRRIVITRCDPASARFFRRGITRATIVVRAVCSIFSSTLLFQLILHAHLIIVFPFLLFLFTSSNCCTYCRGSSHITCHTHVIIILKVLRFCCCHRRMSCFI